jgi:hypothetical protein
VIGVVVPLVEAENASRWPDRLDEGVESLNLGAVLGAVMVLLLMINGDGSDSWRRVGVCVPGVLMPDAG